MSTPTLGRSAPTGSRSSREIGLANLAHARAYAENVRRATERVAALLRSARIEEANDLFAHTLDGLNVLVITIDGSAGLLGSEFAASLPAANAEAETWVQTLIDAQESQDWIRVADVLEYDVSPALERWSQSLRTVAGAAAP